MSEFWSYWIIVLTVVTFVLLVWVLFSNRKVERREGEEPGTTGHVADGIEELDNPLPAWWFNMFVLTIVFGVVYLLLMPGLGNFKGLLGWTSIKQWEEEVAAADARYAKQFEQYLSVDAKHLASNEEAMNMAGRIFANNCAVCHGSDARGAFGFPNLRDDEWLYGGRPEQIQQTIENGRKGAMPAWGQALNDGQLQAVADYVVALGEGEGTPGEGAGKEVYGTYCASCHGAEGTGNQALGSPNLIDDVWLYGGSRGQVIHTVRNGRNGVMPAHGDKLSDAKIHLLTGYVLSLSNAVGSEVAGRGGERGEDVQRGKAD